MSENEIRVLYVQPGKYPEERTIPNTLRALQELVGGDIECCRPWRDSVCVICNDSGKIDGLPPNRLYGHTDFLAGSFVVCGNGGEDFISLTDRQVFLYDLHKWFSTNYNVEVHAYVKNGKYCVVNNTYEPQDTTVYTGDGSSFTLHMDANEIKWYNL